MPGKNKSTINNIFNNISNITAENKFITQRKRKSFFDLEAKNVIIKQILELIASNTKLRLLIIDLRIEISDIVCLKLEKEELSNNINLKILNKTRSDIKLEKTQTLMNAK